MYRIVLDTETAGAVDNHKTLRVYDFGFAVLDEKDNIVRTGNWVVSDIYYNSFMMGGAYYENKLPQYEEEIAMGIRTVKRFADVKKEFAAICAEFNVKQVWAFNAGFDRDALNATTNILSNGICEEFLPHGVKWCDIQQNATALLCNNKKYWKFCAENNYMSKAGNCKTSAEIIYRFLTGNTDFVEAHTGLEDVKIEAEIFHACRKLRKKMDRNIKANAWRTPQKGFKEFIKNNR